MTHPELVSVAAKWLRNNKCSVVITELVTAGEVTDAIGWQGAHSILVECKTSYADFVADANKQFRREPEFGIGIARYYLAPQGVIDVFALPARWGLLELRDDGLVVTAKKSEAFEANARQEVRILLSTLRRIGHHAPTGVSISCYTIGTKNTATLRIDSTG